MTLTEPLRHSMQLVPHVPRHRGPYDKALDIARKNGTQVPAAHSFHPDSIRTVIPR